MQYRITTDPAVMVCPKPSHLFQQYKAGHFHFTPEFFIQISGTCRFTFPDDGIVLLPGQMLLIPCGLNHVEFTSTPAEFHNLVVTAQSDWFGLHFARAKNRSRLYSIEQAQTQSPMAKFAADICQQIVTIYHRRDFPEKQRTLQGLAISILSFLLDALAAPHETGNIHPKILASKTYILNHLASPELNVKKIAANLGCNPDYLSNLFHTVAGVTITQYVNDARMESARELLTKTAMNISQIAYACGFSDPGYFTRIFKREFAMTPREYRLRIL